MTKDEALAALREDLTTLQDACYVHQDEYGTRYYAPDCEGAIDKLETIIDTVQGLHTTEFVAEWLDNAGCEDVAPKMCSQIWRAETGAE